MNDSIALHAGDPPEPGQIVELAEGLCWSRLPLPYAPFHVNTYLVRLETGFFVIDTGLSNAETEATWQAILAGLDPAVPIAGVLATHWHSDHMGSAGWLCQRTGADLYMTEAEYLSGVLIEQCGRYPARNEVRRDFFLSHGMSLPEADAWIADGYHFLDMVSALPGTYRRVKSGDVIGGGLHCMTYAGHSPESLTLFGPSKDTYFCADQLTPLIAPNVAVQPHDPSANPLEDYFRSLDRLRETISPDALVLPAHELPYHGARERTVELRAYYETKLAKVVEACARGGKSAYDLLGCLWKRTPSPVWIGFMLSEVVSYANYLVASGKMRATESDGVIRFSS